MPWFKVDDGFHGHPKVVELGIAAVGLWTLAGSWCAKYLTDGFVPDKTVTRLGGGLEQATELVESGLWDEADGGGYWFRDWADYQPLKVDVEAERAAAQERMRSVRAKKKGVRPNESRTDPERSAEPRENIGRSSEEVRVTPSQSQSQSHPSPIPSTPKGVRVPRSKPETALPDNWQPNQTARQYAVGNGIDLDHEVGQFRAHVVANDRRQKDWDAAFRMWLGNAKKWSRPAGASKPTRTDQNLAFVHSLYDTEQLEIEQ